jgi:hypothetical protein
MNALMLQPVSKKLIIICDDFLINVYSLANGLFFFNFHEIGRRHISIIKTPAEISPDEFPISWIRTFIDLLPNIHVIYCGKWFFINFLGKAQIFG